MARTRKTATEETAAKAAKASPPAKDPAATAADVITPQGRSGTARHSPAPAQGVVGDGRAEARPAAPSTDSGTPLGNERDVGVQPAAPHDQSASAEGAATPDAQASGDVPNGKTGTGAAAAAAPAPVSEPEGERISVVGPEGGRRRAGRRFGPVATVIPLADLSEEDLAAIEGDPELRVSRL